jgi:integrase
VAKRAATLISVLAYAGLRSQEALKTRHSRIVLPLAPVPRGLAEWRLLRGRPEEGALVFPSPSGAVWNDRGRQTWHRDAWDPACGAAELQGVRPYDLRHSFVSLLIHEGRSVIDITRQAGHSPTMALDVYAHVFDEFDPTERVSAAEETSHARRGDGPVLCPPPADGGLEDPKSLQILTAPAGGRGSPS